MGRTRTGSSYLPRSSSRVAPFGGFLCVGVLRYADVLSGARLAVGARLKQRRRYHHPWKTRVDDAHTGRSVVRGNATGPCCGGENATSRGCEPCRVLPASHKFPARHKGDRPRHSAGRRAILRDGHAVHVLWARQVDNRPTDGPHTTHEAFIAENVRGSQHLQEKTSSGSKTRSCSSLTTEYTGVDGSRGALSSKDESAGSVPGLADAKSELAVKLDRLFDLRRKPHEPPMSNQTAADEITAVTGVSISPAYIWGLRNGSKTNPTLAHLRAIAEFFGVPPSYLIDSGVDENLEKQLAFLEALRGAKVRNIAMRASGITPQSLESVTALLDNIRRMEQLPPVTDDDAPGDPE